MKAREPKLEVVDRETPHGAEAWSIAEELLEEHHLDLERARICLVWMLKPKTRKGKIILGMCQIVPELWRRIAGVDVVIYLLKPWWLKLDEGELDAEEAKRWRRYLVDHELMHAMTKTDGDGETVVDELDKFPVYQGRGHDVEEFAEVIDRNQVVPSDLGRFLEVAKRPVRRHLQQLDLDLEGKAPTTTAEAAASAAGGA